MEVKKKLTMMMSLIILISLLSKMMDMNFNDPIA